MRSFLALLFLVGIIAFGSGCQSGSVSAVVPIAGGGTINVPMTRGGPPPAEGDGFKVDRATIAPSRDARELRYEFALQALKQPDLKRIRIDDMSDETAVTLIDDGAPQFSDGKWLAKTDMISADDQKLKWIFQITA